MTRLIDLVTPEARPALHDAISCNTPTGYHRQRARDELQSALEEAYELGRTETLNEGARDYYDWLRAKGEHPLAHINSVESFITERANHCDVEDCDAPGCSEGSE